LAYPVVVPDSGENHSCSKLIFKLIYMKVAICDLKEAFKNDHIDRVDLIDSVFLLESPEVNSHRQQRQHGQQRQKTFYLLSELH